MSTPNVQVSFVTNTLNNLYSALEKVEYFEWFVLLQIILLLICCISRLLCQILTIISPNRFSHEHRSTMHRIARTCYWYTLLSQLLIFFAGSIEHAKTLALVDYASAICLLILAVVSLIAACISMMFKRHGKRVYIAKSLCSSSFTMLLMGSFLAAFSFVLFG